MTADLGLGTGLGFLVGIVLHEFATAALAVRLGDKTSRLMRRVTLSPKQHIDPLGTLIVPGIFTLGALFGNVYIPMFGWGKRHALSPRGLRNPKRDVILVSLAGPAMTALLAVVGGALYRATADPAALSQPALTRAAGAFLVVNIFLTIIELLPMPGRDGGRILARFLSPSAAMKMEELAQYDVLFLLGIFFLGRLITGTLIGMADPLCRLVSGAGCGTVLS